MVHTNIATAFEVGGAEGRLFIAMEYVTGKSLREVIAEGALPPSKPYAARATSRSDGESAPPRHPRTRGASKPAAATDVLAVAEMRKLLKTLK